jgi:D-aminoacyl-tRNA deacylase
MGCALCKNVFIHYFWLTEASSRLQAFRLLIPVACGHAPGRRLSSSGRAWRHARCYLWVMRAVIQRVTKASVAIEGKIHSSIGNGLLVFIGIEDADTREDIEWLSGKIVNLRIFNDANGVMNESILEKHGEILLISQFTLHAATKKGNRPSYIRASKPEIAIPIYEEMIARLKTDLGKAIGTGIFGADMKVELLNDGPVTIIIDTKYKE